MPRTTWPRTIRTVDSGAITIGSSVEKNEDVDAFLDAIEKSVEDEAEHEHEH